MVLPDRWNAVGGRAEVARITEILFISLTIGAGYDIRPGKQSRFLKSFLGINLRFA
jgi:hypothetical protein